MARHGDASGEGDTDAKGMRPPGVWDLRDFVVAAEKTLDSKPGARVAC